MSRPTAAVAALVAALTSACAAPQPDEVSRAETTGPVGPAPAPVQHADGTCWAREVTPAIYEHVSGDQRAYHEQVTDEGTLLHLPIFRRAVAPKVLRPREDVSFEAPCPALMTYDFTASLQRALAVRGYFAGNVTGEMDAPTSAAIRRYQSERGLDSGQLSLATARELGLAAVERDRIRG
ncbi:peptidoglycan-binding domain-containing protein [Salipiger sp.]|uniref:peptidoglycan-binding domain-containing protein n=1 Tax=Salipiger sp. TaxID=2078585 RepID=UPI003A97166E